MEQAQFRRGEHSQGGKCLMPIILSKGHALYVSATSGQDALRCETDKGVDRKVLLFLYCSLLIREKYV